jgi:hypothetical protein
MRFFSSYYVFSQNALEHLCKLCRRTLSMELLTLYELANFKWSWKSSPEGFLPSVRCEIIAQPRQIRSVVPLLYALNVGQRRALRQRDRVHAHTLGIICSHARAFSISSRAPSCIKSRCIFIVGGANIRIKCRPPPPPHHLLRHLRRRFPNFEIAKWAIGLRWWLRRLSLCVAVKSQSRITGNFCTSRFFL